MWQISPRQVERSGDDTPAQSVFAYVWRMSGRHQVGLCLLAIAVTGLALIPLELQRRIINEAIGDSNLQLLLTLGGIYLTVVLLQQGLKVALRSYEGWVSESAIIYTRRHILSLHIDRAAQAEDEAEEGRAVQITGSEIDKLGGFVGEGLSRLCANASMLIGVMAYMLVVQPRVALVALAFLVPQILLTPLIQRKLNQLTEQRVNYLRGLGEAIADRSIFDADHCGSVILDIYRNRFAYIALKSAMKALINLLNLLAPGSVLVFGGYLAIEGQTTLGVIVAFISAFERIADPIRELLAFYRTASQAEIQHAMIARWMTQ